MPPPLSTSSSLPAMKLAGLHRQVTHPVRLLQENMMMELYEEQLRMPSPVNQQSHSSRRSYNNSNRGSNLSGTPRPAIILYEPAVGTQTAPNHTASLLSFEVEREPRSTLTSTLSLGSSSTSSSADASDAAARHTAAARPRAATMEGYDTTQQRECKICFDKMDALQLHGCVTCNGTFCSTCMQWYVEYKILDGEVSSKKLVCPAPQCVRPLSEELIEAFASPDSFTKYKSFLRNQKTGVRFCPRAGCCAIIDEPLFCNDRKVVCTECETESCMRCGGDYHRMRLCRKVEKRYGKWKRNHDVRACPTCSSDIEKQGGCCHMKCFQCDQEFCWSCLRPWDNHDETLCIPLAFFHSKSRKYGCWTPLRFVTKSVVFGVASVVVVAGAGVAVVVLPPLIGYHLVKDSYRKNKHPRGSYAIYNSESTPQP